MDTSPEFVEQLLDAGMRAKSRGDLFSARTSWLKAARRGSTEAMLLLGVLMDEEGDSAEALRWFKSAAETGDSEAMTSLGVFLFKDGRLPDALAWFKKAADAGNTEAMVQLGNAHHHLGQHDLARSWYQKAANAGDSEARHILGALASSSQTANQEPRNGGCYIATAVYGSYDAPQVLALRRFRDESLSASATGRVFIRAYYAVSPMLARFFTGATILNRVGKTVLDSFVARLDRRL